MFELIFPRIVAVLMGLSPAAATPDTLAAETDAKGKGTATAAPAIALGDHPARLLPGKGVTVHGHDAR
jgi:hypothetical protein